MRTECAAATAAPAAGCGGEAIAAVSSIPGRPRSAVSARAVAHRPAAGPACEAASPWLRDLRPARPDQAAGLRRLFPRATLRLLPVLVSGAHSPRRSAWLARLAAAFARRGSRTLVIDAARAQIAGALGLRARFDWLHALRGECAPRQACLDAGDGLRVLPAARAVDQMRLQRVPLESTLAPLAACGPLPDLALAIWPAAETRCFAPCDAVVPVTAAPRDLAFALADIRSAHECADIRAFRLLFLGMAPDAAATLAHRMAQRVAPFGVAPPQAECARVGHDLAAVAARAQTWRWAEATLSHSMEKDA